MTTFKIENHEGTNEFGGSSFSSFPAFERVLTMIAQEGGYCSKVWVSIEEKGGTVYTGKVEAMADQPQNIFKAKINNAINFYGSEKGIQHAKNFSKDKTAKELIQAYSEILEVCEGYFVGISPAMVGG